MSTMTIEQTRDHIEGLKRELAILERREVAAKEQHDELNLGRLSRRVGEVKDQLKHYTALAKKKPADDEIESGEES